MTNVLTKEAIELLDDPLTVKVLTTVDESGIPHSVIKDSLAADEDGNIFYLERTEFSRTGRNLIHSLWFNRKVTVLLKGIGDRSVQIKGIPVKTLISGPVFQRHYVALREQIGDADLSAVWIIRPDEVVDQSWAARLRETQTRHPGYTHLDRLVRV